jgi:hypothetical protein
MLSSGQERSLEVRITAFTSNHLQKAFNCRKTKGHRVSNLRRISGYFSIFIISEMTALLILSGLVYQTLQGAKFWEFFSSLLFSFGSLLLTTAIVYDYFWRHPELSLTGVIIEPYDSNQNNIVDQRFRRPVYERAGSGTYLHLGDNIIPDTEDGFKVIETSSPCYTIKVTGDVCNIGGSKTTIHEYTIRMLKPNKTDIGTYIFRRELEHEERATIDFTYPATSGEFEFEIEVISSTKKKSRRVKIVVSDDLMAINWK